MPWEDGTSSARTAAALETAILDVTPQVIATRGRTITTDDTGDNTSAIQDAIDEAAASYPQGCDVLLPPGKIRCNGTIVMDDAPRVGLVGAGPIGSNAGATWLKRGVTDDPLIQASGTETANMLNGVSVRNVLLHGNDLTAPILEMYHTTAPRFYNVDFFGTTQDGLDIVNVQDGEFAYCRFDQLATSASSAYACVKIRNSAAASGYGYSADNSNELKFHGCIWETFKGNAVNISQGTSNSSDPNGFYFSLCKFETITARHPFFEVPAAVTKFFMDGCFFFISLDSGASAVNLIKEYGGPSRFWNNLFVVSSGSSLRSVFYTWDSNEHIYSNIVQYGSDLLNGFVESNGNDPIYKWQNVRWQNSSTVDAVDINGGTPRWAGSQRTCSVSGAAKTAAADSDWYDGKPLPGDMLIVTNTSDSSVRLFVKTALSSGWKQIDGGTNALA